MLQNKLSQIYGGSMIVLASLVSLLFINNPGTNDVITWLNWMNNLTQHALVKGYALNGADYPPFSSLILFCVGKVAAVFQLDPFLALKYSLLIALFAATLLFYLWTRNIFLSTAFHLALLLNSLGLVYLDIYFVPVLILSFWSLQKNRWIAATIFLSLAILIKWQALIFVPLIGAYFLQIASPAQWQSIPWRRILWQVILPAGLLVGGSWLWFGNAMIAALIKAMTYHYSLSANALNINWIINYGLHLLQPAVYGAAITNINLQPTDVLYFITKKTFFIAYALVLLKYCLTPKTYVNLLLYSVLACCTYFMINLGVHENHLMIAVVLAGFLAAAEHKYQPVFVLIALSANINLAMFYVIGLFTTYTIGPLPMTVVFAAVNSIMFLLFYYSLMRPKLWRPS